MATKTDTPDAKERTRLADAIEADLRDAEKLMGHVPGGAADIDRAIKTIRDKVAAAQKDATPKGLQALKAQAKPAKDIEQAALKRMGLVYDRNQREKQRAELAAVLTEARMNVGKVADKGLTTALAMQITAAHKKLEAIAATKDNLKAIDQMNALEPQLRGAVTSTKNAIGVDGWTRGTYAPLRSRVAVSIKRLPNDRLRKVFEAEMEEIEVDRQALVIAIDVARLAPVLGSLRNLDAQIARICALSPALDRELARIGEMLQKAGRPAALMESLRAMVQHKAGGWPKSAKVDEIEREVNAFEASVAGFAATAAKEAVARKTAKA
jgi:hypothetical protein